jgi:hypothetical protein
LSIEDIAYSTIDGWMDGWMDGWVVEWVVEWMNELYSKMLVNNKKVLVAH